MSIDSWANGTSRDVSVGDSTQRFNFEQKKKKHFMDDLISINKPYVVQDAQKEQMIRVNDIDCIRITFKLQTMQVNATGESKIYLPLQSMWIDLKSLTAKIDGKSDVKFHLSVYSVKAKTFA